MSKITYYTRTLVLLMSVLFCTLPTHAVVNDDSSDDVVSVRFSVLGAIEKEVTVGETGTISAYSPAKTYPGKVFVGWSTLPIEGSTDIRPTTIVDIGTATFTESTTLYAVFACQNGGVEEEMLDDFNSYTGSGKYNKTEPVSYGMWSITQGSPAITDDITDKMKSQSMVLQWNGFTSDPTLVTRQKIRGLTGFSCKIATTYNDLSYEIEYSTDSVKWVTISSDAGMHYGIRQALKVSRELEQPTDAFLKFEVTGGGTKTGSKVRMYIDDVTIYSQPYPTWYSHYSTDSVGVSTARLTYDVNGGTEDISSAEGVNRSVSLPKPKRGDIPFLGWKVVGVERYEGLFLDGATYLLNHDVVLEAQWGMCLYGRPLDIVDWSSEGIVINMNGQEVSNGIQCNGTALSEGNYSGDNTAGDRTFFIPVDVVGQEAVSSGRDIKLSVYWNFSAAGCSGESRDSSICYYRVPYIYSTKDANISADMDECDDIVVRSGRATLAQNLRVRSVSVYPRAELVVGNGATLTCDTMYLRTRPCEVALLTNQGQLEVEQMYYTRICADTTACYSLSLPFESAIEDMRLSTGEALEYGAQWLLKRYDSASRAQYGMADRSNWTALEQSDTIEACTGYTLRSGSQWYREYCFPVQYRSHSDEESVYVTAYQGDASDTNPADGGWNFISLPGTSAYVPTTEGCPEDFIKVSELQEDNCTYAQHVVTSMMPAKPFYYQTSQSGLLTFGEQLTFQPQDIPSSVASQQQSKDEDACDTQWLVIALCDDAGMSDSTHVYIHPSKFSDTYESPYDLIKMPYSKQRPVVFSIAEDGDRCFNALSDATCTKGVALGYNAPEDGTYTLSMQDNQYTGRLSHVYLKDTQTGKEEDLLCGSYEFDSDKGEFRDRFILRCDFVNSGVGTDIEDIAASNAHGEYKFLYNGHVYITRGGRVYDMLGQVVEL